MGSGAYVVVHDTAALSAEGTAAEPVVITALEPPAGTSGAYWNAIHAGGALSFTHTQVSWGGIGANAAIECVSCVLVADHLTVEHSASDGVRVMGAAPPTVTNSTFSDNGGHGFIFDGAFLTPVCPTADPCGVVFDDNTFTGNVIGAGFLGALNLRGLSGNSGSGNGAGNTLGIGGSVAPDGADDFTFDNPIALSLGAYSSSPASALIVSSDTTLHLAAGQTLKMGSGAYVVVHDTAALSAEGTAAEPVVITALEPPAGTSGAYWNAIHAGGALSFTHTQVSWGGIGANAAIECVSCVLVADHLTVEHSASDGVRVMGAAPPTVTNSTFSDNGGHGFIFDGAFLTPVCPTADPCGVVFDDNTFTGNVIGAGFLGALNLRGLSGNSGSGNGAGNTLGIGGSVAPDGADDFTFDNPIALSLGAYSSSPASALIVSSDTTLHLAAGQTLKMGSGAYVVVHDTAALSAEGTAAEPVVITALEPPAGTSGAYWNAIHAGGALSFTHTQVSWGGIGANAAIECVSCVLVADHLTVEHSASDGVRVMGGSAAAGYSVFTDNAGAGITSATSLTARNLDLVGNGTGLAVTGGQPRSTARSSGRTRWGSR